MLVSGSFDTTIRVWQLSPQGELQAQREIENVRAR
jgi:hypothetical protein